MPGKDRCESLRPDGIRALTRVIMIHESQPDAPQSIIIKQHLFISLSLYGRKVQLTSDHAVECLNRSGVILH